MQEFKTGQQFTDAEMPRGRSMSQAFAEVQVHADKKLARKRRRQGLHQSYISHPTAQQCAAVRRSQGERDDD